jgi:hypothetical protein
MPGTAVGLAIGKGAGQGAVHRPPPFRRRVAVDGRPGERVPEFDAGIVHGDEGRGLGRDQVGELEPQHRRRAGQHRHVAAVDSRGEDQSVAGAGRKTM